MQFKVVRVPCSVDKRYYIKEYRIKSDLSLDVGMILEFKDKLRADVICDMLNKEFDKRQS